MLQPTGEIAGLDGHRATVVVDAGVACARCAAGRGCGAGLLSPAPGKRRFEVEVPDGLDLACGDRVRLELRPRDLLGASWLVYGMPLLAMTAVPALAEFLFGPLPDPALAVLALSGIGAAMAWGRRRLTADNCLQQFVPTITAGPVHGGDAA